MCRCIDRLLEVRFMQGKCFLCGQDASVQEIGPLHQIIDFNCTNCGKYQITDEFRHYYEQKNAEQQLYLLSGYVREMNEKGKHNTLISYENYGDILASPLIPHTIGAKYNKFLRFLYHRTSFLRESIKFSPIKEYSVCYAKNSGEAEALIILLRNELLIQTEFDGYYSLTFKGIQLAESLEIEQPVSINGFVAMWFSTEMISVYKNAIKPAIEAPECGNYKAYKVDEIEHNDDITDRIIAGIRESRFVVADLTGYRGGVYFEAGFAKGLGKPVIYTCRKDWFYGENDVNGNIIKEKVHFDLNHQNTIIWETEDELRKRIIDRIRATIY